MRESFLEFWTSESLIQALIIIFITSGIGLFIGKQKIGKFSLGGAGVFFFGIFLAHFGVKIQPEMLQFCQNFGLILFVYALGVQVGPSFVSSLKSNGLKLNAWSLGLILFGLLAVIILNAANVDNISNLMGVLSGAVTNTPALAAAQQGVEIVHANSPTLRQELSEMALATAITYPLGVIGVIIVLELLKLFFPTKSKLREEETIEEQHFVGEYQVVNEGAVGRTLDQLNKLFQTDFTISRIYREGKVFQPMHNTILQENDLLRVVSDESDVDQLVTIFGRQIPTRSDVEWDIENSELVQKRLVVSKAEFNGASLSSLRLRNRFGVTVTRITRAEIDLIPHPNIHLQIGDRLTVVGPEEGVKQLTERIGNQLKPLESPYLISIFVGITIGCILGSVPILLPGLDTPIKLGLAGGPIIIGILMGAYGPRLKMTTYITHSANLMVRTLGITLYLACLGLSAGGEFIQTIVEGAGMTWLILGLVITMIPTLIIGLLAMKYSKLSYASIGGLLCGSMANPVALDYLNDQFEDDSPTVSYATVYPVGMFLRVILAQIVITILL